MAIKKDRIRLLELFSNYGKPYSKHIIIMIFLSLASNFFLTLQPMIIAGVMEVAINEIGELESSEIIEDVGSSEGFDLFDLNNLGKKVKNLIFSSTSFTEMNIWYSLIILLGAYIFTVFISILFNYSANVVNSYIRTGAVGSLRSKLIHHLFNLNLGFFSDQKIGELISRFAGDAVSTAQGIGSVIHRLLHSGTLILIYACYLVNTNMLLAIASLGIIAVQFGCTEILKKPIRNSQKKIFDTTAQLSSTIQESLINIRIIKSFGVDLSKLRMIDMDINKAKKADFKANIISYLEPDIRMLFDAVAIVGIIAIAASQMENKSLNVQGFILFVFVGKLLINPINMFSSHLLWIQKILASYDRIDMLLIEKTEVIEGTKIKRDFVKKIEFNNVSFSFGTKPVLSEISYTINKGEVLAIVGPSGAGKSSLADLILRLYDPTSGQILIDGIDLKSLKTIEYRNIFGVVAQESFLFNNSIINNIIFGRNGISEVDVINAAKIANVHDFIIQLPEGYQTFIGDRGVKLSGGQKQRIAIARAIVCNPLITIFDEATSSLDSDSEKLVQAAIERILENKTAIIIAHRLSTVLRADRIMVLNKGKIEMIGKHQELLESSHTYNNLYQLQFSKGLISSDS